MASSAFAREAAKGGRSCGLRCGIGCPIREPRTYFPPWEAAFPRLRVYTSALKAASERRRRHCMVRFSLFARHAGRRIPRLTCGCSEQGRFATARTTDAKVSGRRWLRASQGVDLDGSHPTYPMVRLADA